MRRPFSTSSVATSTVTTTTTTQRQGDTISVTLSRQDALMVLRVLEALVIKKHGLHAVHQALVKGLDGK